MLFLYFILCSASRVALHGATQLAATGPTTFEFQMGDFEIVDDGEVAGRPVVSIVLDTPVLERVSEPELPLVRDAIILPHAGNWRVEVSDIKTQTIALGGKIVRPSLGRLSVDPDEPRPVRAIHKPAYSSKYPAQAEVELVMQRWRETHGAHLQILPMSVQGDQLTVITSLTVRVVCDIPATATVQSTPTVFYELFSKHYINWNHFSHLFRPDASKNRVLIVAGSEFQTQANTYSTFIKGNNNVSEVVIYDGKSADDIQAKIKSEYNGDGLMAVTIFGRSTPTKTGQHSSAECDNCYSRITSATSLDVFMGRISTDSAAGADGYNNKISNYSKSSGGWLKQAYGTAFNLCGDEYKTMTTIMDSLTKYGMTASWGKGKETSGSTITGNIDKGLGIFVYLGHGSGTSWCTPMVSESDIDALTNSDQLFFEWDVSCLNGGFQHHSPCFGEKLITAKGGAITTMMSAPCASGTMCKQMQMELAALIAGGMKVTGALYTGALMKANAKIPDNRMLEAYNVFGDSTLPLKV